MEQEVSHACCWKDAGIGMPFQRYQLVLSYADQNKVQLVETVRRVEVVVEQYFVFVGHMYIKRTILYSIARTQY